MSLYFRFFLLRKGNAILSRAGRPDRMEIPAADKAHDQRLVDGVPLRNSSLMSVTSGYVEAYWTGTGRRETGYFAARSRDTLVGEGTPSFCGGQVASRLASAPVKPSVENLSGCATRLPSGLEEVSVNSKSG